MKIYTRGGDKGETGLVDGTRTGKDDPRLEAYGTVDELNSHIGMARALDEIGYFDDALARIQRNLFVIGSRLACPDPEGAGLAPLEPDAEKVLEGLINEMDEELETLTGFILPGGTRLAASFHIARTVCRRCERHVVALARSAEIAESIIIYINRLSDTLFTAARMANRLAGRPDELRHD